MNPAAACAAVVVLGLLAVPAALNLATRFRPAIGWHWTPADFATAAVLLGGGAAIILRSWRRRTHPARRLTVTLAVVAAVALLWVEGATGVFSDRLLPG